MKVQNNRSEATKLHHEIDFQQFFFSIISHWKWFALSVLFFLFAGLCYLRYTTPVYSAGMSLLLKNDKRGGNSELAIFQNMGLIASNNSIENEIEVFRSRALWEKVVAELGLYISYWTKGKIKDTEYYPAERRSNSSNPPLLFIMDVRDAGKLYYPLYFTITPKGNSVFELSDGEDGNFKKTVSSFPYTIQTKYGDIKIIKNERASYTKEELPIHVYIKNPYLAAGSYQSKLSVGQQGENTSILRISITDTQIARGEDALIKLVDVYNQDVMEDKNRATLSAASFINDRLQIIGEDLKISETDIETYRQENRLANVDFESRILLQENNEFEKQLVNNAAHIKLLNFLESEVKQVAKSGGLLPATLENTDPRLVSNIELYNSLVLEKDRIQDYTKTENPVIKRLNDRMSMLLNEIQKGIEGVRLSYNVKSKDLKSQQNLYDKGIGNIPHKERILAEKIRQQQIKETLYTTLLEKKEDTELALAANAPSAKILESPLYSGYLIAPDRRLVLLLCLLVGLILPAILIRIKQLMKFKIETEEDIEKITDIPVVVALPQLKNNNPIVVTSHADTSVSELFRLLRANVRSSLKKIEKNGYESDQKVILVTSSISGEGKTFVSANLALTFALKFKTLIVGLDIRRPKLSEYFHGTNEPGLTSYLNGDVNNVDDIISTLPGDIPLDIIFSGSIPHNPNELLMDSRLDVLFTELRKKYDYIIIDTSPVGSVSDTFLLDRIADVTLFIACSKHTPKDGLNMLNQFSEDHKFKNPSIVLNKLSNSTKRHSYGYRYGYGYGYGYNNSNGVSREKKSEKQITN